MQTDVIARAEFDFLPAGGSVRRLGIEVHRPYAGDDGEWDCIVVLPGLHTECAQIRGEDAVQALMLALDFVRRLILQHIAIGDRLRYRGTDVDVLLDAYFPAVPAEEAG